PEGGFDAEARLPPPPPAEPLARGVPEVLVRDPRPARPPAREGAPHPALRAAPHPGRPDQRRPAGEPRRGGALRRRGRALVGEPRRPRAGARDPGSAAGRPRAPRGRAALHRPRALGALARDRAADPPLLTGGGRARERSSRRTGSGARGGSRAGVRPQRVRSTRERWTGAQAPGGGRARERSRWPTGVWGHRKRAARESARALDGRPGPPAEAERESAHAGRRGSGGIGSAQRARAREHWTG